MPASPPPTLVLRIHLLVLLPPAGKPAANIHSLDRIPSSIQPPANSNVCVIDCLPPIQRLWSGPRRRRRPRSSALLLPRRLASRQRTVMALSTVHDKPALAEPPNTAAASISSAAAVGEGTPPELVEADFLTQVLQIKNPRTATWLDDLITKAIGLGITVTRPSTALSASAGPNVESSTAESSVTLETNHTRTASSESNATLGTALTSDDEHHQHDLINNILARKRSRTLTFSQYDKYLAQTNPNIAQPRFVASPTGDPEKATTSSLFSISTRKSYLGIRSGLTKIRRKRKAPSAPESFLV